MITEDQLNQKLNGLVTKEQLDQSISGLVTEQQLDNKLESLRKDMDHKFDAVDIKLEALAKEQALMRESMNRIHSMQVSLVNGILGLMGVMGVSILAAVAKYIIG